MKVERPSMSPAEMLAAAEKWYDHQMTVLERCHGKDWPSNKEWVSGYLRQELRERLIANGWRPKP